MESDDAEDGRIRRAEREANYQSWEAAENHQDWIDFHLETNETVACHLCGYAQGLVELKGYFKFEKWDALDYIDIAIHRLQPLIDARHMPDRWNQLWHLFIADFKAIQGWQGDPQTTIQAARVLYLAAIFLRCLRKDPPHEVDIANKRAFDAIAPLLPYPIFAHSLLAEECDTMIKNLNWLYKRLEKS